MPIEFLTCSRDVLALYGNFPEGVGKAVNRLPVFMMAV